MPGKLERLEEAAARWMAEGHVQSDEELANLEAQMQAYAQGVIDQKERQLEAGSRVLEARIRVAIAELDNGGGTLYANGQEVADAACKRYLERHGK